MKDPDAIALFIDPMSHHFERDGLFDVENARLNRDQAIAPYAFLRDWFAARGVRVHTADRLVRGEVRGATNVYVSLGIRDRYRSLARRRDVILSAFFAVECPVVEPNIYRELTRAQRYFKRLFSFSDADALAPFLRGPVRLDKFHLPQPFDSVDEEIWKRRDRGFLTMINTNKLPRSYLHELYTERLRAVEFFGRTGEIDLYGMGWDGPPYRMGETRLPATLRRGARALLRRWRPLWSGPLLDAARRAYRGPVGSKAEVLGRYRFALCFENMVLKGWVTEKIFDCFVAGTVPIYRGAPDIESYVPPDCFIDMRRFAGYAELAGFLRSLSEADILAYRENAREYLRSSGFRPFTKAALVETFARFVEEDTGVSLAGIAEDPASRAARHAAQAPADREVRDRCARS